MAKIRGAESNPRNAPSRLVAIPKALNPKAGLPPTPSSSGKTSLDAKRNLKKGDEETPEHVRVEYDVYATPYIPAILRSVNDEPGHTMVTESEHKVDFDAYLESFAGRSFVPVLDTGPIQHATPPTGAVLTISAYFGYFDALWKADCAAKELENELYSLYRVPLYPILGTPNGRCLWRLSIPGLREDSPLIQMGDTLQLRLLYVDGAGNLTQVPVMGSTGLPTRSWTGVQYNASVYSSSRAEELVYLKIEGLKPFPMQTMPAYVNVVFPLKQRLLQTQLKALNYVSEELQKMPHPPHDGNLADIGDQVLSQVASHILEESTTISQDQNYGSNPWIRKILFPDCADGVLQTSLRSYPSRGFFDSVLNYEQAHAVDAICENKFGVLPYLISGPPGTGKTKTLVEAAMQLLNTTSVAHVLICAPSEPAADTIAIRLKAYLPPGKLLRLNSPGRSHIEVPQELMQYTYTEKDMFYLPPFQQLMAYNIVVTSCRDASILVDARLTNADLWSIEKNMLAAFHPESSLSPPPLHWGALLLDEAAQATEVDVLPALSVIMPPSSFPQDLDQPRLAMAGDDNQLGPRIASQDSLFSTSLFARLFERPLFKNHPLSRSNVRPSVGPPVLKKEMLPILYAPFTNLVRNYRSHPAILSVPSNLFYNDTLIPEAAIPSTPLQASPLWQGRKWPVLFIPHTGADEIERDGGGWYNHSEAKLACDTAQHLWAECGVAPATICIMSPFAAQVKQLRALMRSAAYGRAGAGLWDVNIGPLEAFQGLEKRVVIICTTRTRSRFLRKDAERGLGLVHQRRKMNVAVTRAMEALVVIGSPLVLRQDEHWSAFLAFCARNGLVGQGALAGDGDAWRLDGLVGGAEEQRIGVLEKALLVREEREKLAAAGQRGRALGSGAASLEEVDGGLYEEWIENLKAALEDEEDGGDDGDDVEEEVGQGEEDEEQEDQGGVAG